MMGGLKGEKTVGNATNDKNSQLTYLKERLSMFMNVLDSMDPEYTEVEDIDRLIGIINEMETKVEQFKK